VTSSSGNPFSSGFRAARANLIPGLIIQALMIAVVAAYYWYAPAHRWFEYLAWAKGRWGYGYTVVSSITAGAVMPMLMQVLLLQRGKIKAGNCGIFLFLVVFWSIDGVAVDTLYRVQAMVFGAHADVGTVVKKVLVDMCIYNPAFAAPFTAMSYEFRNLGYPPRELSRLFSAEFYRTHTIPTLCATWMIWVPVVAAIYSLPSLLQIPLFALALTFWVLMLAYMTARKHPADGLPAALAGVETE
jgi:hypothetical protein